MRHPFEPLTLIQIPKRAQPPIRVGNPIEEAVKDFLKAIKISSRIFDPSELDHALKSCFQSVKRSPTRHHTIAISSVQ